MKTWRKRLAAGLLTLVLGVSLVPGAFAASAYDCPGQKLAALTFDDGPGRYSAAILDTLKAHGAKATFFMNGYNIWIYASQVQRMVAEGHQVANHTYNHPDLVQSSDALVRQEVDSLAQALTQITGLKGTGNTSFYLRPPFGSRNQRAHFVQIESNVIVHINMLSPESLQFFTASAIKEMVENSIDAGATRITVEIQHGGSTYMRITEIGRAHV